MIRQRPSVGIQLGEISAQGEAHFDFCCYLKRLKERGIILAVNSKNNPDLAKEVFEKHPEMPLNMDDFSVFCCNWTDKGNNLKHIARELNIGLDSLVMIDDSPVECAQIRDSVPEVTVVEMDMDPANFVRTIESGYYFELLDVTAEDSARAASYIATRKVQEASASGADLGSFLDNLDMAGSGEEAVDADLPRLEQMMLKTNQFNLATRRHHQKELKVFMEDDKKFCLSCRLKDKYSYYGIVSCVVGAVEGNTLVIDNWVMSCRVFSRTFEEFILKYLIELAGRYSCDEIRAEYFPTLKNGLVPGLLAKLGFQEGDKAWWTGPVEGNPALDASIHIKLGLTQK